MKINEVEKLLGITKANIRFYEKEGLLTPQRSENGYRDYSQEDIAILKEIIILRKLGIPVQQIADIQDGVLPLQQALDSTITALQWEIQKLSGSLSLCRQLKSEDAHTLDTERYWELIIEQETQGLAFQTLAEDYLHFIDQHFQDKWYIPQLHKHRKLSIILFTILFCLGISLLRTLAGSRSFTRNLQFYLSLKFIFPFILGLSLIPAFIIERKSPKYGELARGFIKALLVVIILFFWLYRAFQ